MDKHRGILIEFSGVDGSGKSTQASMLAHTLAKQGVRCILFDTYDRKFFNLTISEKRKIESLRDIYTTETAEVLMMCDEVLHYNNIIRKHLDSGITVICARSICDRYTKARVFGAINARDIKKMESLVPCSDIHFFLMVNLNTAMKRISMRGTDNEEPAIMERYIKLSNQEAQNRNWIIVDGNLEKDCVASRISAIAQRLIGRQ